MERRIYLSPPWTGEPERRAVDAAFASGWIAPCGPAVDEFERRLAELSGRAAAAVSGGTAALDLVCAELNVGPETHVFASTLTFIASVGPAFHRGARLAFVDADPATGTISLPLLARALAARPAAARRPGRTVVIAVDLYGRCCDYDALEELCAREGATLMIDAAEAVGATCRMRAAGNAGFASVYSFNGNKILTTSGGGAVLAADPAVTDRARWRAQQARENTVWYEHREVGYNYRLSNLLAALGNAQLDRLDEILRRKRATFAFYEDALHGTAVPFPVAPYTTCSHWLSVFLFPSETARDAAAARLTAANVECRPVWKPLHLQPVFADLPVAGGDVAGDFFRRGLCLPSGAGLEPADRARIAEVLLG